MPGYAMDMCMVNIVLQLQAASPTIVQAMLLAGTGVPHRDRVTATPLALAQLTDRVRVPEPPQGTLHTDHGVVTKLYCLMPDSTVRGTEEPQGGSHGWSQGGDDSDAQRG